MEQHELEGIIIDVDYASLQDRSIIRITLKNGKGIQTIYDPSFYPYFRLIPHNESIDTDSLSKMEFQKNDKRITIRSVTKEATVVKGKKAQSLKIEATNPSDIPIISEKLQEFGERYEYDILFWKRYLIDKSVIPLQGVRIKAHEDGQIMVVDEIQPSHDSTEITQLCFDIETYNPMTQPRPKEDPVIMISYATNSRSGVLTTKKVDREFVTVFKNEKELIEGFVSVIKEIDPDVIAGYNSSNFDIPYLMERSAYNRIKFDITRYGEEVKREHHGLLEAVKIPGRVNMDIYNVAKFVSIVGASDKLLKINNFTLGEVYAAVTNSTKITVDKKNIWQLWDNGGKDLEELTDYSLSDSKTLNELYNFFAPLEVEVAKVSGTSLGEASVSTTGQLVEYLLMRYANANKEMIPNKPSEAEIFSRTTNPIEGAYVKTPEAGIYDNIAVFDFRGLYPSIIIAYNIDPNTLSKSAGENHESPTGAKFVKKPEGIVPKVLRILISDRTKVKAAYKKDPDNKNLGARSNALKILANSFYGYLGYARSRWYSRECAESVTAFGRNYIKNTMEEAEKSGFKVLYGDTDSIFLLMQEKTKEDAKKFLDKINKSLPDTMELELEDSYVRGVFVGKKNADLGAAKKKYALLSESGRIKIKGFELVRRDWSYVSRDTQKKVLEAILKEGSKSKAVSIVKDVIAKLNEGKVPLKDLIIYTQLRKKIDNYDAKSPELAAAKKAIEKKIKTRDELEGATIGYIITRHGNTISEKAELAEIATDYDPAYYINNQVIPATLKILKELGFSEEELKWGGSQKRL
ncbi:MAG: hypothetical protein KGI00_00365 [Candidatus Micrarchaeota archaeon]|nr:hypothetical protein [Candidatus Micrarchaeota archaeon]